MLSGARLGRIRQSNTKLPTCMSNWNWLALTLIMELWHLLKMPVIWSSAAARISATEAYRFAAQESIQVHGGIGFTWEANTQFHYRRSKLLALSLAVPVAGKTVWSVNLKKAMWPDAAHLHQPA
ncbi:MAG: hypothetical protein CM15mP21_1530 [Hyphomicrobiales bacterium]|nr:MAG: hypothetical protein CM15mP21_1530 [Hyphomicrobiales bacterium]